VLVLIIISALPPGLPMKVLAGNAANFMCRFMKMSSSLREVSASTSESVLPSTGSLSHIINGAPYDKFLAAVKSGLTALQDGLSGKPFVYAMCESCCGRGQRLLRPVRRLGRIGAVERVKRLAISNPESSPSGAPVSA
jgi:hypothetical protein